MVHAPRSEPATPPFASLRELSGGICKAALLLSLTGGCGGRVAVDRADLGGGGPPSTTSATGSGPDVGATGTTSGGPDAQACQATEERFELAIVTASGDRYGCTDADEHGTSYGDIAFTGELLSQDGQGNLELDTCPPNAECDGPTLVRIRVAGPGLYIPVPPGVFLNVRATVVGSAEGPGACAHRVQIKNLPFWNGAESPYGTGSQLWLAASDGLQEPFDDAPFGLSAVALGCHPGEPTGCAPKDAYVWRFADPAAPGRTLDVPMGQTEQWKFGPSDAAEGVSIRNLRSYSSGLCDDDTNWAYWVAP